MIGFMTFVPALTNLGLTLIGAVETYPSILVVRKSNIES